MSKQEEESNNFSASEGNIKSRDKQCIGYALHCKLEL
jgi:hypothetical protein